MTAVDQSKEVCIVEESLWFKDECRFICGDDKRDRGTAGSRGEI